MHNSFQWFVSLITDVEYQNIKKNWRNHNFLILLIEKNQVSKKKSNYTKNYYY